MQEHVTKLREKDQKIKELEEQSTKLMVELQQAQQKLEDQETQKGSEMERTKPEIVFDKEILEEEHIDDDDDVLL